MKRSSQADLRALLQSLGLPQGGVYIVHSSLLRFGLIDGGLPAVLDTLWQVLGPGSSLLMPTFTFSYGQSRHWDLQRSKAETGALSEHFRTQAGTLRTLHPMHSLAVAGPHAQAFADCRALSSFGPGSPFALLYDLDAWNIGLGTDFVGGATFLHHAEQMAAVPYRFHKPFPGRVCGADGQPLPQTFTMFAREIGADHAYSNRWDHVWHDMCAQGLVRQPQPTAFAMRIRPAHDWLLARLQANPYHCAERVTTTTP